MQNVYDFRAMCGQIRDIINIQPLKNWTPGDMFTADELNWMAKRVSGEILARLSETARKYLDASNTAYQVVGGSTEIQDRLRAELGCELDIFATVGERIPEEYALIWMVIALPTTVHFYTEVLPHAIEAYALLLRSVTDPEAAIAQMEGIIDWINSSDITPR